MASLGALSKLLNIQKWMLHWNSSHNLLSTPFAAYSAARYVTAILRAPKTRRRPAFALQPYCAITKIMASSSVTTTSTVAEATTFGTGAAATSAASEKPSIDEFREREEKREEEFARQQAADEAKANTNNAEDEAKRLKIDAIRKKILDAALVHVATHGWTRNAIVQGAEDVGMPSVVHGMFPEGGFALVSYFNGRCNKQLLEWLQCETQNTQDTEGGGGGAAVAADPVEFLTRAVRTRLELLVPYKAHWPQAMALIALPQNASTALAQVLTLVDDICYFAGDRSVNINWYTRRIGLATIMKMTELHMLQDNSAGHVKTWEFLRNRMEEAVQVQLMLAQSEDITHNLQRSFNSAFITARNILGLGYRR